MGSLDCVKVDISCRLRQAPKEENATDEIPHSSV